MNPEGSLLTVEDLELWRGERCLFTGLSFSLQAGQVAVIRGANGSGKTTLLRVLAGLSTPRGGIASWRGQPIANLPAAQRGQVLYQGHMDGLKRELTVVENLDLFRRLWGISPGPETVLDELRLGGLRDRPVLALSAGQRRRAALARLGLSPALMWVLDEPFTNLDDQGRDLVERWLSRHLREGGTGVVATHQDLELDGAGQLRVEL